MDVVRACLQAGQSSGIAFTGSPGLGLEKETGLSLLAPLLNRQILLPLLWKTGFSSHGIVSERTVTKLVFLKFKPHERAVFEDGQGRGPTCGSRFGAEIITRSIQWAKLGGSVVNLLAMDGSVHKKQEIRSSLGTWWLDAHEVCYTFPRRLKTSLLIPSDSLLQASCMSKVPQQQPAKSKK